MRVTFVAIGSEQMGVSLLASIAKEHGHCVDLAFSLGLFNDRSHLHVPSLAGLFDDTDQVMETIRRQRPDVLAFSAITPNYRWMLDIARRAKEMLGRVQVIFGGVHPSALPDLVLAQPQVDYVVVGEGERAFPRILKAVADGGPKAPIPNTRFKLPHGKIIRGTQEGFIQDLDSLPIFDKTIWEDVIPLHDAYITMASRGCPYRCTFCFNNFFANLPEEKAGRYVRQRSVEHLMRELRLAQKRYKPRMLEFFDDVFTVDKAWLRRFTTAYAKEIGIPFQIFTHVKFIDEDVASLLAQGGCFSAQIGIQSMDDEFKRRNTRRYETASQIERALRLMKKYRIRPKFDHLFGLPGEPLSAQESARQFYAENPPYSIQTYWVKYFPGTEIVEDGRRLGLLTEEDIRSINEGRDCDMYANSTRNIDPCKIRAYQAYQIVFKLMPLMPRFIRRRLGAKIFMGLPIGCCTAMSFMLDLATGLLRLSIDHILYLKYYAYHLTRFICAKVGIRLPPATKVRNMATQERKSPYAVDSESVPVETIASSYVQ